MWINTNNLKVYKFHSEIRKDFKNVSMPHVLDDSILDAFGIVPVTQVAAPDIDHTKNVFEGVPALIDGVWTQVWEVTDASDEEIAERHTRAAASVRDQRGKLLAETDWVVVFHTEKGTNIPLEWEVYRQALRDITAHDNFPHLTEDDWPVKP